MKARRYLLRLIGVAVIALAITGVFAACGEEKKSDSGQPAPAQQSGGGTAVSDACKLVTQEDATKLFGKPATRMTEGTQLDPTMVTSCNWTWDTDTQNQLLQFSIWNGEQYYGGASFTDAQSIDLGDKGIIRTSGSVTIQWVQNGKTIDINFNTIDFSSGGRVIPEASTKVEEVKALARKVEKEL